MTPARKNGLVLLKLKAFGNQTVHSTGAPHHVKHRVTRHTLDVVVVRPVLQAQTALARPADQR